jgi:hypothetical protein
VKERGRRRRDARGCLPDLPEMGSVLAES